MLIYQNNNKKISSIIISRPFLILIIYQFILHIYFSVIEFDPRLMMPHLIAFIHDFMILITEFLIFRIILRLIPDKYRKVISVITFISAVISGIVLAVYPGLLREYLVFPVNIFKVDAMSIKVFILEYLGLKALIPGLIVIAAGIGCVFISFNIQLRKIIYIPGTIILIFLTAFSLIRPSPHPLVFSIQQQIINLIQNEPRAVPSLSRSYTSSKPAVSNNKHDFVTDTDYQHIIISVLEGVTADDFENEFFNISDGCYQQNKSHMAYFRNYYTTNQDSYTSLIAMMTSIQVPYRAYAGTVLYENVNNSDNMVRNLHSAGYYSAFISTYEYQPFVPDRNDWDKIFERKDLPSAGKWVSVGSSKMEAATEDKAASPTIIDISKRHKKSLIVHELVYGHTPEWRSRTGKSQIVYYNEYLTSLFSEFKKENLLSSSLFIVVSDHGDRSKSSSAGNYRIPLLIYGSKIEQADNNNFFNHLDFQKIIYHYLTYSSMPEPRKYITAVGSTEKWVYGKITQSGYIFIEDSRGVVLSGHGNLSPLDTQIEFQNIVNDFSGNYGR